MIIAADDQLEVLRYALPFRSVSPSVESAKPLVRLILKALLGVAVVRDPPDTVCQVPMIGCSSVKCVAFWSHSSLALAADATINEVVAGQAAQKFMVQYTHRAQGRSGSCAGL